ncbi:tetratricopeptide repeat protein [Halodesulfovibrio marinisediminis]|uniref:Tetratricopeptide repeat-containing protein n=1 Tax=Halodesulfovibrio marinisediminis DSM 17456 TaxID=1121457 RepID=A0A1N6H2E4_9BACT|nr:tetratricopeptide repeat protein [Halodesulfovibrio marinisediminis]SIO13981.1 Tetratricopeptide repeat-containing protein [Halodesulfovibrio marinisediminis DSM 17456]
MIKHISSRLIWLIVVVGSLSVALPAETQAASWYWGKHPKFERLVIAFDSPVKNFTLTRTGKNELTFVTPQKKQAVKSLKPIKNGRRINSAQFLAAPKDAGKTLRIRTKLNGFRVKTSRADTNKIAFDIYPDRKGTFTPATSKKKASTKKQPAKKTVAKKPAPVVQPAQATSPAINEQPTQSRIKAAPHRKNGKQPFFTADNAFRSRVNKGGPESWVTQPTAASPAQSVPANTPVATQKNSPQANIAQPKPVQKNSQAAMKEPMPHVGNVSVPEQKLEKIVSSDEQTKIVWVDKNGNEVAPPPSPDHLLKLAKMALNNGVYDEALDSYKELKRIPTLTKKQRNEVLNGIADTQYAMGKNNLTNNYESIIAATTEAMNFDLKSPKVPSHLLRLGYTNLKIGNVREAGAYFNILRRNHPKDDLIPATYYYWGEHYFKEKEWQKAADNFQYIVQKYPDTKFVREAGVGLARSLYQLAYYDQAYQIVDYVGKRWPRFYLDYPPFLSQMGDVAYRLGKSDEARMHYWTYYNIDPDGDDADMVLARLGDIYLETEEFDAAREIYEEAVRKFPSRDGGLVSLMRLAEEGKYDTPTISDMFSVFDKPYSLKPLEIYSKIIEEYPQSRLAPLARLKKAIWYLWNNQHPEALATASSFMEKHPNHELIPRVKEVAMRSFSVLTANNIKEENYEKILQIWDDFPIVHNQEPKLTPESRVALALSMWKKNKPSNALEVLDPFFQQLKIPEYSEMGLSLALSVYVDNERWNDIIELARRVELWELNDESKNQLDYAVALAHENLDQSDKAVDLWTRLKSVEDMPRAKEAYINYFLSRDAERREEFEPAYKLGITSLRTFKELAAKDPEKADNEKIRDLLNSLMDITERTGRSEEALEWARELAQAVPENDPGYPAMRYRIASLYKKTGDIKKWKDILSQLVAADPKSLYGRMATSDLTTQNLSKDASSFSPTGSL